MRRRYYLCFVLLLLAGCSSMKNNAGAGKVLVFSATKGFRHASIGAGKIALLNIGSANNWIVDTTEDAGSFTAENLARYKAIVFLSTTGNVLDHAQEQAFQQYIRDGGGFVGIHGAADTEYDWPWYNQLLGAYFESHPKIQEALYLKKDHTHPTVRFMPDSIRRTEEIYNFRSFQALQVKLLLTVDEKTYSGGKMGEGHPAVWCQDFDGGRSFYTAWGHQPEAFAEPLFVQQLTEAIRWVMNKK